MSADKFSFLIMADTGEGDRSQYALLPLIRALDPEFILIAGDIAYPAGRTGVDRNDDDYLAGFFEPYANLNIPIWGVPGNHEYYGPGRGGEFFETFCSTAFENRWSKFGLRLVQQPGSFWELREPGRDRDLVVIGIDTGMQGNLDGKSSQWQFWKGNSTRDSEQLSWLRERLEYSQRLDNKVIILFHIPALADQENKKGIHLEALHRMIGAFPCVKAVFTGHVHNYQHYSAAVFQDYLETQYGISLQHRAPEYFIIGGGGAYLNSTEFKSNRWICDAFPDANTWKRNNSRWRSLVARAGLEKTFVARIVDLLQREALSDADTSELLSLIRVEVERSAGTTKVTITPVVLEKLERLFAHLPDDEVVDVREGYQFIDQDAFRRCLQVSTEL